MWSVAQFHAAHSDKKLSAEISAVWNWTKLVLTDMATEIKPVITDETIFWVIFYTICLVYVKSDERLS